MTRNPYLPPSAVLHHEDNPRHLPSLVVALLAGIASWFAFVRVLRVANDYLWIPYFEESGPDWVWVHVSLTAVPVYFAFGVLLGMWRGSPWWSKWAVFTVGVIISIFFRSLAATEWLDLALGILRRSAFMASVATSGLTIFVVSKLVLARSNNSLQRP